MKKTLFIMLAILFLLPVLALADVKVIKSTTIMGDASVVEVCIDGYKYTIVMKQQGVSIVQNMKIKRYDGTSVLIRCK